MLEITRKDSIYVRSKLLNICNEKLERIEYMSEKTRKDSIYVKNKLLNICKEKLEKIEYMSFSLTYIQSFLVFPYIYSIVCFLHILNLF
jgi:hypothetical protein